MWLVYSEKPDACLHIYLYIFLLVYTFSLLYYSLYCAFTFIYLFFYSFFFFSHSFILIRKKYCVLGNFQFSVFDGLTLFGMSWIRFQYFWTVCLDCLFVCVCIFTGVVMQKLKHFFLFISNYSRMIGIYLVL